MVTIYFEPIFFSLVRSIRFWSYLQIFMIFQTNLNHWVVSFKTLILKPSFKMWRDSCESKTPMFKALEFLLLYWGVLNQFLSEKIFIPNGLIHCVLNPISHIALISNLLRQTPRFFLCWLKKRPRSKLGVDSKCFPEEEWW